MSDRGREAAERMLRTLLRLYPRPLRDEAGEELLAVLRDQWQAEGGTPLGRVRLVGALLRDALIVTAVEHGRMVKRMAAGAQGGTGKTTTRRGSMEAVWRDVRLAVRGLRHSRGLAVIAIVVLALGIGANATLFTVTKRTFFDHEPHLADPGRLVRITRTIPERGIVDYQFTYPDYAHYRDNLDQFDGVVAYDANGLLLTVSRDAGEHVPGRGWLVSGNYFDVLGVEPALGRWFSPVEDRTPGTHAVAVLSFSFWQSAFGGSREVLGSRVQLNGSPFTVVGVAPAGFGGVSPVETSPDLWVPLNAQPILQPELGASALRRVPGSVWSWLSVIGRLRDDASFEVARAELSTQARYLAETYPEWSDGQGAALWRQYRFRPGTRDGIADMMVLMALVSAIVLVIATANVSILLLARSSARRRDVAVRIAIGAGRLGVLRSMIMESVVLAMAGGVVGFLLAYWLSDFAAGLMPGSFHVDLSPDAGVLALTLLLAGLVAVAAGGFPAFQAGRGDVAGPLRGTDGLPRNRANAFLVTSQLALSVALVIGAGVLVRSLVNAKRVDLGFETAGRTFVTVPLAGHGYGDESRKAFMREAVARLGSVPGVESVGTAAMVPFRGMWTTGLTDDLSGEEVWLHANAVAPGYLDAMGLTLLRGRDLTWGDDQESGGSVLVNETAARELWGSRDPIGQRFEPDPGVVWSVVGVVSDATYYELGESPVDQIYYPQLSRENETVHFVVAAAPGAGVGPGDLRGALLGLDASLAMSTVSADALVAAERRSFVAAATMAGIFASLALLLAASGLYGVLSYSVVRQTREIGIRIAMGASRLRVARRVVGGGVRLALVGTLLGLVAAWAGARVLEGFLFGVDGHDPLTFVVVPFVLLIVAAAAGFFPAVRAARLDPRTAIGME